MANPDTRFGFQRLLQLNCKVPVAVDQNIVERAQQLLVFWLALPIYADQLEDLSLLDIIPFLNYENS